MVTKCYKNTSTSALQVLAGCPPLDLVAASVQVKYLLVKKKQDVLIGDKLIRSSEIYIDSMICEPWLKKFVPWDVADPIENQICYYTDGSKMDHRVGCAYLLIAGEEELASQIYRLNDSSTVFLAELYAIYRAALHARDNGIFGANLYSDSMSVLQSLSSYEFKHDMVEKTKELLIATNIKNH